MRRALLALRRQPLALGAAVLVLAYGMVALATAAGLLAEAPDARVGAKLLGPGPEHWLGTERQGRDILARTLHGARLAVSVGLVTALLSVVIGATLGALAGWFRGPVDAAVTWLFATLQSIPSLLLLVALAYVAGRGLFGVYVALIATAWVGPCRLFRAEVLRLRQSELVLAARALGYGPARVLLWHLLPNTAHLALVQVPLLFAAAVKAEVILSVLGLGVVGQPSWGVMINQSRGELIGGFYLQLGAAAVARAVLLAALNVLGDALEEAADPRRTAAP